MRTKSILILLAIALRTSSAPAQDYTQETGQQKAERFAWFNQAKFGMFIHWGLYSVPAGEYKGNKGYGEWFVEETKMPMSQYEQFAQRFNPTNFNAREWVRIAKAAGMRYICITSKHHDGFGLWNSKLGDWNIGRSPFRQREPLKELADACKAEGLTFCLYHSIMDWHHPLYGDRRQYNDTATGQADMPKYVDYMKGQLRELITQYGPIGILWFDGGWENSWTSIPNHGPDLYNYVRGLQPSIIINDRGGKGDYGTPEQTIPGAAPKTAWETCMTLNDHWGYNKNDHNWKSTTTLIRNLIDCASKGGNYLLNVGPTSDGLIPFESVTRLEQVGQWMKQNGEAIYGTTPGPFRKLDFGRATIKGNKLFLFVFDVPSDRKLSMPSISAQVKRAYFLADSHKKHLDVISNSEGLSISLPKYPPVFWNEHANAIVCECDSKPESAGNVILQSRDGTLTLTAQDAEIEGEGPASYESGNGKDNIGTWLSEKNVVKWPASIAKPGKYKVTLTYACMNGSEGTKYEVSFGRSKVSGQIDATGNDWVTFKTVDLGTVEISAGKIDVRVTPTLKPGMAVMNLRAIGLTPAEP